ncbi:hypothetical protein E2I00_005724 [Balaenoptera physalus]|uniref:Protein Wiz n=1 Tax=Balaenoptera physalus TaxID=9770 RepID=A0A643C4C7_BALPH|nr:hypothetical protein E2I00_005724 [Balaenoptera physalus]
MDGPLAGGLAAPDRPRGPERLPGPAPREDIEGGAEVAEGEGCIFRSTHYLPVTKEGPRDILDGRGGISDGQPHPGLSEALPRATSATHRISSWFEDSVIIRTVKPHTELEGSRRFDWLQDPEEQAPLQDAPLHLDLPPQLPPLTSFRTVLVPVEDTTKTLDVPVVGTGEHLADLEGLAQPSEWSLPRSASEVATQTWTVNSEASVERLQPLLPPIRTRPYLCELLEEVAEGVASPDEDEDEEPAVFPCIECSIYFKQKEHLLEHMSQHRRAPGQEPPAELAPLACGECGWAFADPGTLEQHRQLHQASREKIIEEIQKLKQVPGDEGREARLQCPKCVFGTNSSKAFVQHAKLHMREPQGQAAKEPFGGGSRAGSPSPDAASLTYQPYGDSLGLSACVFCGFPAPSESLLREHVRLVHAHWEEDGEASEEDPASRPGTSQDAYARFSDAADYFGKAEPLLAPMWQGNPAGYDPSLSFGPGCQQLGMRDFPLRSKSAVHPQGLSAQLGDQRHPWSEEEEEEDILLASEMDFSPENGVFAPSATPGLIPQSALELKQTFREALQTAEASRAQQQQLCGMVPVVLVAKLGPQVMAAAARAPPRLQPEELGLGGGHPLDFLLLDTPLGGPLGLDTLLDGDPAEALKHEERKCPYCPDRFHNGIGLANHVRGHLNRVGVSYNVRHFISAEEVKAIERRFSFQKKKKKVANFDPGTFSLMRCDFCGAGFDTRAGLSSHARAHLRDFGITNWELTVSPINILQELLATSAAERPPSPLCREPGVPPSGFLTSRRPRLPLTVPFPPTWAEDPGPAYGDGKRNGGHGLGLPPAPQEEPACPWAPGAGGQSAEQQISRSCRTSRLVKQKGLPDTPLGLPPGLTKKSSSPKEMNPEDKSPQLSLSPRPASPKAQWPQSEDEGPLNLSECGHARAHLRHLGVSDPDAKGSPIDVLHGLIRRDGVQIRLPPGRPGSSLEARSPADLHLSPLAKKLPPPPGSPLGHSPTASPPPTARKMFPGLSSPSLPKKLKPEQMRVEIKREMLPGALHGEPHPSEGPWVAPREDMTPLNLSSRAEPVRDIRCEFCGEFFENRKGLSSHARSHLRQMGVTEWYVNGSPIDTLREILKRRTHLAPITGAKPSATSYLGSVAAKRPLQEDRLLPAEVKAKTYIQTELPFKAKTLHEKTSHSCKQWALASHARAHLRQFGVTEWCVNGSPIETLSEWIKHRPQKVGAYRSYIQGGRPFTKKFRSAGHGRDGDKRPPLGLAPGGLAVELPQRTCPLAHLPSLSPPFPTSEFERRQARPPDSSAARGGEEANDLHQKLEEVRQPPPRVRPVPSLVPRPPQTSLVKFVGNIYTLKCRFCEVEFQGPLSIQEEWVRHLQRHILEMNFSKADPPPEEPQAPQAQTAAAEAP